jgi:hypothetical protein
MTDARPGLSRRLAPTAKVWAARGRSLRDRLKKRGVRRTATAAAAVLFAGGALASWLGLDLQLGELQPGPLVAIALAGVPPTLALNSLETWLSARALGKRYAWRSALLITVYASAANMLPLPGGAMVRIAGLRAAGAGWSRGGAVTLAIALVWLGAAFGLGAAATAGPVPLLAGGFTLAGAAGLGVGLGWLRTLSGGWATGLRVLAVKLAAIAVTLGRIWLALAALGVAAGLAQVSVFAVADVLGSAVSIVPAGLGVREAVSAGLAPAVALAPAAAFLAAALNRLIDTSVLALIAGLCSLADLRPPEVETA